MSNQYIVHINSALLATARVQVAHTRTTHSTATTDAPLSTPTRTTYSTATPHRPQQQHVLHRVRSHVPLGPMKPAGSKGVAITPTGLYLEIEPQTCC